MTPSRLPPLDASRLHALAADGAWLARALRQQPAPICALKNGAKERQEREAAFAVQCFHRMPIGAFYANPDEYERAIRRWLDGHPMPMSALHRRCP